MSATAIKVLFADDHELFREGLKGLLQKIKTPPLKLLAAADNGKEAVDLCEKMLPDIVLMDIEMPELSGIEATRIIKKKFPKMGVLGLSTYNENHLVLDMLAAGASGYLLKNTTKTELAEAIRKVYEGGIYFTPETAVHLATTIKESKLYRYQKTKLTEREIEVLKLVCKGFSSKEIASRLELSVRTIDSHRAKIHDKTGTANSIDLVVYSIKHSLIDIKEL